MGRVNGKVAIVTGGASGLGAASASLLAREGAKVLITDLQVELGQSVARAICQAGGEAIFAEQDVRAESTWPGIVDLAIEKFGGLNVVLNDAGIAHPRGSVEEVSLEDWRAMFATNVDGVFLGTKYGIEAMRRSGNSAGSIINISSTVAIVAVPGNAAYSASKGAVRSLTKSAALHCAKQGYKIRVNSIHPGFMATPMLFRGRDQPGVDPVAYMRAVEAVIPLGHAGEPDDIAYGVLYLASDESKYVTGSELVIDGGFIAQ